MRGAAGFCRPEWLIGLPAGKEGAVSGEGGREGRRGHCPRTGPGAEARPPLEPGARDGRQRPGGLLEARCKEAAGAAGAWVPSGRRSCAKWWGLNFIAKEKAGPDPQLPGRYPFLRARIATLRGGNSAHPPFPSSTRGARTL